METTFPLAAFQRQQHLATAIQVAEPFGMFGILEVRPRVIVHTFKPFEASRVAREPVTFYSRNKCFKVYPPQLLIPFELLRRETLAIHEIEYTAEFLVPTVIAHGEGDVLGLFYQFGTTETLAQVHDEPHGLDIMPRSDLTSLERIGKFTRVKHVFHNDSVKFGTIKYFHHLVYALVDDIFQEILVEQVLYFERQVAQYHRQ